MASVIFKRTLGGVVDTRIVLQNSNFCRPHGVTSWTTLRVGVRMQMGNTGANLSSAPLFALGLCSGSTNIVLDATTTHFLGIRSVGATWTWYAGNVLFCSDYTISSITPAKKVGSTWYDGSQLSSSLRFANAPAKRNRFCVFVDITKGSPNYSISVWGPNANCNDSDSQSVTECSTADFIAALPLVSPPTQQVAHSKYGANSIAVNEGTDGVLDQVACAWDRFTPSMEICDIGVARLA